MLPVYQPHKPLDRAYGKGAPTFSSTDTTQFKRAIDSDQYVSLAAIEHGAKLTVMKVAGYLWGYLTQRSHKDHNDTNWLPDRMRRLHVTASRKRGGQDKVHLRWGNHGKPTTGGNPRRMAGGVRRQLASFGSAVTEGR